MSQATYCLIYRSDVLPMVRSVLGMVRNRQFIAEQMDVDVETQHHLAAIIEQMSEDAKDNVYATIREDI